MDVRFVILAKPGTPNRDKFRRLPAVVGRAEDAAIRLPADYVSRRHCEFVERDGVVLLRDLGSTNGTSLDGETVSANTEVPVRSGGLIQIGGYRIRVEYGTSGTTAVAAAANVAADVSDEEETVPLPDTGAESQPGMEAGEGSAAPEGDFGFLATSAGEDASPLKAAPDDGDLDSFFKSLS